jgi:hypothetical protein
MDILPSWKCVLTIRVFVLAVILCVLFADSDYQLVSEAQTPGVNNQTPPELPSYDEHPKRNNVSRNGDLFENFKNNRDRYPPSGHPVSSKLKKENKIIIIIIIILSTISPLKPISTSI